MRSLTSEASGGLSMIMGGSPLSRREVAVSAAVGVGNGGAMIVTLMWEAL